MTNKEIERFIKKNIIGYIGNDLIQKETYILIKPYNDILGGFCLEPSPSDKNSIYIWWFVQPLFIPDCMINLTFGDRLEYLNHNQSWSNLDSIETIEIIRKTINDKKYFIESIIEPHSFYDYFNKGNKDNVRICEALIYILIWTESTKWKQEIKNFIGDIDNKFDTSIPWIKRIKDDLIDISISDNPKNILEDKKKYLIKLLNI